MRRNSIILLKYLAFAIAFLIFGPLLLKSLFGEHPETIDPREPRQMGAAGLPESPDEMIVRHKAKERQQRFFPSQKVHKKTEDLPASIILNPKPKFSPGALGGGEQIDWHNYKEIEVDKQRTGPGEQGAAVILSASEEKQKDALYKVNGFNAFASDKISLNRAIKDIRHPQCKNKKYHEHLPNASIVVPFHNEHWSTLLRTAHSVFNRSPKHLIHEVILVDDFSTKEHCKKQLDDYAATHFNGRLKIIHADKREGLIRTRILGAKHATGEVLIFLDAHVEANVNWLPPLLDPIAKDYRTVVCPFIDVIDFENFAYRAQDEGARGAFDWEFFYKRLPLLPEDLKHPAEPFKSPVMAGGLFAISTKWFWELGGYDPGLDIWGGEQYELSFKIWQCHGSMVDAPCSRVGHVYRTFNPHGGAPGMGNYIARLWQCGGIMLDAPCSRVGHIYRKFAPFPNPGIGDFVGRNYRRVAETWMDEYAEYLYKRRPHYKNIDTGDLTEQLAIRKKLKCKSFKWFMTEIAFDLPKHYPPIEPPNAADGELRSSAAELCLDENRGGIHGQNFGLAECGKGHQVRSKAAALCLDTRYKNQNEKFGIEACSLDHPGSGGEQQFEMSWHKDIRPKKRSMCLDVSQSIKRAPVLLYHCHGQGGNQRFKYKLETNQLFHPISRQCLDCDTERREIYMNPCDDKSLTQKWTWQTMNRTHILEDWQAS